MKKINFKSDFDLLATMKCYDTQGKEIEIGFANYDWELDLYTGCGNYAPKVYKVSYIGGKATNCFNDNGKVHIVCDNHSLNLGVLNGTIRAKIPNAIYPDGTQLIVSPLSFAIELVADGGDTPSPIEVEIMLPYLYDSIYRIAQQSGYKGSQEEYYQLASQLPNAVETANKVQESADSLADSATIVKTSAEQIGGNIADLQASVSSIDDAVEGINQGASTIANSADTLQENVGKVSESATKVEQSVKPLVQASESLNATKQAFEMLSSEWISGRTKIADALTRKYSPTEPSESFDAMAQKVMDLPLAVEGQEGIIDQTANGIIDGYDLLNELHKHQRQDYPYCCGVEFTPQQYKSVILSGAEAYLCSDGFFTTEQEVEHTFAEDNKLSHYIIYYYTYPTYQVPTAINPAIKLIAYNGQPRFILSNYYCPMVQSYTNERYSVGSAEIGLDASSLVGDIMLSGIETMSGKIGANSDNTALYSISLPHLKNLGTGGNIAKRTTRLYNLSIPKLEVSSGTIAYSCNMLTNLELPSLNKVEGGTIAYACNMLEQLKLPNVKIFTDGTILQSCDIITSISIPELEECGGQIANNCKSLESVSLPNLKKITQGILLTTSNTMQYLELPNLETTFSDSYIVMNQGASEIHLPKLRFAQGAIVHQYRPNGGVANIYLPVVEGRVTWGSIFDTGCIILVHLGKQQGKEIVLSSVYTSTDAIRFKSVTVEQEFRSSLDIHYWTSIPKEDLEAIIDNLADNNDYEPLTLTLGTTLKNKLSEEYIAIATAKNYNIA